MLAKYAPWFQYGRLDREPLSYRAWKRFLQARYRRSWTADLFDRIENTDWDLLVILDACRYDVVEEIAESAAVSRAVSPATATPEFLKRARNRDVFDGTTYISANPQSTKHPPSHSLEHVDVSDEYWDDVLSTVPPAPLYQRARTHLERDERVVVHTIQPHYPPVCEVDGEIRAVPNGLHPQYMDAQQGDAFQIQRVLSNGLFDLGRARLSYEIATKFAWRTACTNAASMASAGHTVAITADHGELFGEWGLVEHPNDIPVRKLVEVPWTVFRPQNETANAEQTPTDRLRALGYRE